ncbi:MlaD family protein [Tsukamurella tyrosinosolvens]|uniref:MlaD family protein n=1 Tax=Tsukamurella tyrosinosolvens TaxID=57704 RepID=UPI000DF687F0|nr:MlaD family protein [Tsukamurella tyrosinosolvens]RDB45322.1 MCE family protein [Tsukamurella tyrosinosolvens]
MRPTRISLLAVAAALLAPLVPSAIGTAAAASSTQCAYLADGIGLYPDNDVTQMGVKIGSVRKVEPSGDGVKVTFDVAGRTLPATVKAVTRSTSILADRSLELVGNYSTGATLNPGTCITRENSATPKSISETTSAATRLVDSVTEGGASADLGRLLTRLDTEVGPSVPPQAARSLTNLSTLLSDPAGFLGDVTTVVSNVRPLMQSMDQQWGEMLLTLQHVGNVLDQYGKLTFPAVSEIFQTLPVFFLVGDDMMRRYGHILKPGGTMAADAVKLAATGVKSNEALARMLPVFGSQIAPYLPRGGDEAPAAIAGVPVTTVATRDPNALCAQINAQAPGACTVVAGKAQTATVDLAQLPFQGGR